VPSPGCPTRAIDVVVLTRRQAIVGAALIPAAVVVGWGRFALGGTFEDHVAHVLGVDGTLARVLLERLKGSLGVDYDARAAAFLLATTEPSRSVMPPGPRREAIEKFVLRLLDAPHGASLALAYAGLRPTSDFRRCAVLVRS